jgi:hypothetical protein
MPINAESLQYIKDNFQTQDQIDDYIELLDAVYLAGAPYFTDSYRLQLYKLFTGEGSNIATSYYVKSTNYWRSNNPPSAINIIKPDYKDEAWLNLRGKAVSTTLRRLGSRNASASKKEIVEFLKKYGFGKDIKETDPDGNEALEDAWKSYFNKDKTGITFRPYNNTIAGNGFSLFGSWDSLGVYKDAVKIRLQNFDPTNQTVDNSDQVENPVVDDIYEERIQILEDFLQNSGLAYTYEGSNHGKLSFGLFNKYREKNNLDTIWEDTDQNTDPYSTFLKILSPISENKFTNLSDSYQATLFSKLENSGLLDLLVHVDAIRQFGRDRFKTPKTVQASAALVVNRS